MFHVGGLQIASRNYVINHMIRSPQVRVIDTDGGQLGVMPLSAGIAKAEEKGLDLVLISPDANPPVCRITDIGKLRYEQSKREKQSRKGSKAGHLKEVKFTPKISDHDFLVKAERSKEFLQKGFKVKASIMFRGREMTHPDIGRRHMDRLVEYVAEVGKPESAPSMEGRNMIMILTQK